MPLQPIKLDSGQAYADFRKNLLDQNLLKMVDGALSRYFLIDLNGNTYFVPDIINLTDEEAQARITFRNKFEQTFSLLEIRNALIRKNQGMLQDLIYDFTLAQIFLKSRTVLDIDFVIDFKTQSHFCDHIVTIHGITGERTSYEKQILDRHEDPYTRLPLSLEDIFPHQSLLTLKKPYLTALKESGNEDALNEHREGYLEELKNLQARKIELEAKATQPVQPKKYFYLVKFFGRRSLKSLRNIQNKFIRFYTLMLDCCDLLISDFNFISGPTSYKLWGPPLGLLSFAYFIFPAIPYLKGVVLGVALTYSGLLLTTLGFAAIALILWSITFAAVKFIFYPAIEFNFEQAETKTADHKINEINLAIDRVQSFIDLIPVPTLKAEIDPNPPISTYYLVEMGGGIFNPFQSPIPSPDPRLLDLPSPNV